MVGPAQFHLDAEELVHLGLTAIRQGNNEEGIISLKRALALAPNDAGLHYLLGAQYARIGLYPRAVEEMHHALALNPNLDGGRFQLGWIYLSHGQADAAAETWSGLDKLGEEHPLYLFKTGLLHLAKNEFDQCEDFLTRGINANKVDAGLNYDMVQILKNIQARRAQMPPQQQRDPKTQATPKGDKTPATEKAPAKPQTTTTPPTPVSEAAQPAKPSEAAQPKRDAGPAKPKAPKNVVLSAYQQNKPEEKDSE